MSNQELLICCICEKKWKPRNEMNFHNLCWDCFGVYDRLKRNGRWAERAGLECTESERFFSQTIFPFDDFFNRERLKVEILRMREAGSNP